MYRLAGIYFENLTWIILGGTDGYSFNDHASVAVIA